MVTIPQIQFDKKIYLSTGQTAQDLPNILLISADGLAADNMSAYGYQRKTTPFLDELVQINLKGENAFVNSSKTSGSLVSTYNSKLPITTRMLFPPDTLKSVDSYQHLPGILKLLGYYNVQISTPFYADANSQGLFNGFDIANNQTPINNMLYKYAQYIPIQSVQYFLPTITNRISERLSHIFFIQKMVNPFTEVTSLSVDFSDIERTRQTLEFIEGVEKPLFIHVHMLVTHGDYFMPREHVFSRGMDQDKPWLTDFYDDSILDFDTTISTIVNKLKEVGKYDKTILVVFSDHYQRWVSDMRVPIIIHFPDDAYSGVVYQNTQNLDIAPTILDYLNQDIPDWMEGDSMFSMFENDSPNRIIYSFGPSYTTTNSANFAMSNTEKTVAPFYQFGFIQAVVCDKYYKLDLKQRRWLIGDVYNYSDHGLCNSSPDPETIKNQIINKMSDSHFDINRLTKRPIEEKEPTPFTHK